MGILKKAFSATSSVIRLLLGAGALLTVVIGIKNKRIENPAYKDRRKEGTDR